jgi:hypothetical protein
VSDLSELSKVILILVMIFLVVFISFKSKRELQSDWNLTVTSNATNLSEEGKESYKNSPDSSDLSSSSKGISYDTNNSTGVADDKVIKETSNVSYLPKPSESATVVGNQNTDTNTSNLIPLQSATDMVQTNLDQPTVIYNELKEVELAARKYISAAYKISTLNSYNIYSKSFMNDYLSSRYDVGYKTTSDGYVIYIKPKYVISSEIVNELVKQKGIRFDGESIIYEFWIRAYR